MKIIEKMQACKKMIKETGMKKLGRNEYSKFDYFLPEQVEKLVFDACEKQGLFTAFSLIRDELGIKGILTIYDLESDEVIEFMMATAIPQITATNATQQLGGAMTYTERYLKMTAFGITDNSLDPDGHDQNQKPDKKAVNKDSEPDKPWLNPGTPEWDNVIKALNNGYTIDQVKTKYKISKENLKKLEL